VFIRSTPSHAVSIAHSHNLFARAKVTVSPPALCSSRDSLEKILYLWRIFVREPYQENKLTGILLQTRRAASMPQAWLGNVSFNGKSMQFMQPGYLCQWPV
jgi:hypothetical protein